MENAIRLKVMVKDLRFTTSNINLVVLNNYHLSLDPKSELIYFGRILSLEYCVGIIGGKPKQCNTLLDFQG